jgi:membrane protein
MRRFFSRFFKSLTQRAIFSFEQFSRHEMANHAAAGAYSFLMSAIPAVLVILFISSRAIVAVDPDVILDAIVPFIGAIGVRSAIETFVTTPLAGFTGAFGIVSLIWAARLFVVSIQRGIRVIHADSEKASPVRENLLTFAVELIVIIAIVLIIAARQVAKAALATIDWAPAAEFIGFAVRTSIHIVPFASLWLFVFLTYKNVPQHKPRLVHAAISSALCLASYAALGGLLGLTLDTDRYGLLYGILGNLIVGLIKVYFFFWLYFFFAELCYTIENFDSLLFTRFHKVAVAGEESGRIERALFAEPGRLFKRYSRVYGAGTTIFSRGDEDRSALYLYRGAVELFLPGSEGDAGTRISVVDEGEFFGEMAYLLEEPRSANAIAMDDCTVFVLPPVLFESFLSRDASTSRHLVELMAARLKANNERLSQAGVE